MAMAVALPSAFTFLGGGCRSRSFHRDGVAPSTAPSAPNVARAETSVAALAFPLLPLPFFPSSELNGTAIFRAGVTLVDVARPLDVVCNAVRVDDDAILAPKRCGTPTAPREPLATATGLRVRTDHPAPGSQPVLQSVTQAEPPSGSNPLCALHLVSLKVEGAEIRRRGFRHVEAAKAAALVDGTVWVVANRPENGRPGHDLFRATVDVRKGADGLFDFFDAKGGRDFSVGARDVGAAVWVSGQGNRPRLAGLVVLAPTGEGRPGGRADEIQAGGAPAQRARVIAVEACLAWTQSAGR